MIFLLISFPIRAFDETPSRGGSERIPSARSLSSIRAKFSGSNLNSNRIADYAGAPQAGTQRMEIGP
jgi:hypothetical protein